MMIIIIAITITITAGLSTKQPPLPRTFGGSLSGGSPDSRDFHPSKSELVQGLGKEMQHVKKSAARGIFRGLSPASLVSHREPDAT